VFPTVHSAEAIEALLRRGLIPKTDNIEALRKLGFTPVDASDGSGAAVWERARDHASPASDGSRMMVRERAILIETLALDPAR
jgi:hypothetical protein